MRAYDPALAESHPEDPRSCVRPLLVAVSHVVAPRQCRSPRWRHVNPRDTGRGAREAARDGGGRGSGGAGHRRGCGGCARFGVPAGGARAGDGGRGGARACGSDGSGYVPDASAGARERELAGRDRQFAGRALPRGRPVAGLRHDARERIAARPVRGAGDRASGPRAAGLRVGGVHVGARRLAAVRDHRRRNVGVGRTDRRPPSGYGGAGNVGGNFPALLVVWG